MALAPDRPLDDPALDRFGHAPLAHHLARGIAALPRNEGQVVAIFGNWGLGKSTLLRFVVRYLEEDREHSPIVVEFNPWLFSGHEDLVARYFDELQTLLDRKYRLRKLADEIARFSDRLANAPVPKAHWWTSLSRVLRLFGSGTRDLYATKREVARLLAAQERRLVVVIDDVDRLTAEEIRQIFKLIKAIGDFPNVTYLVALDRGVAAQALRDAQGVPGEEYLGKIVQVPVELPVPDAYILRAMAEEQLSEIARAHATELDVARWREIYAHGIDIFVRTPRDLIRFANMVALHYGAVAGDVDTTDFFAVEALRLFAPPVYDAVRRNEDRFTGDRPVLSDAEKREQAAFHNAIAEPLSEARRQAVRHVLEQLFPRLDDAFTEVRMDFDHARRLRRVCSPDAFATFFAFAVPAAGLSHAELRELVTLAEDEKAFTTAIERLSRTPSRSGMSRAGIFAERLSDYVDDPVLERVAGPLLTALAPLDAWREPAGDPGLRLWRLVERLRRSLDSETRRRLIVIAAEQVESNDALWNVVIRGLQDLDEARRTELLEQAVDGTASVERAMEHLSGVARAISDLDDVDDETKFSERSRKEVRGLLLRRIRAAARDDTLFDERPPNRVLNQWIKLAGPGEVGAWLEKKTADDEGLVSMLPMFGSAKTRFGLDDLARLIDCGPLVDRTSRLLAEGRLSEELRLEAESFLAAARRLG